MQSLAAPGKGACKQSISKTTLWALDQGGEDRLVYQLCTRERSPGAFVHGPGGQTPSLQLDQLKIGVEENPVWWNSQAPCSAAALWQQGLHIRSYPACWTLQSLLCSNHSRQQNSLAGSETSSCPAQLVRESAAHPHAGCSHRAEGAW